LLNFSEKFIGSSKLFFSYLQKHLEKTLPIETHEDFDLKRVGKVLISENMDFLVIFRYL